MVKIRSIYECRCDERLQTKVKEFTRLGYTGLFGGLEHLKTETRLISEKIENVLGVCNLDVIDTPSKLSVTRKVVTLSRIFPTLDLTIEEEAAWW